MYICGAMASIERTVAALLPEGAKRLLRPLYRSVRPVPLERGSTLEIGRFGGFDVAYRVGTSDEKVIAHSFDHDIFFTGVPEYRPREGDTILDVGAHIGTFSLLGATKAPNIRVHAIEASRDTFNLLRINVALNHSGGITAHQIALADRKGTIDLFHATGNWGHSVVKEMSSSSETVPCNTMTDFLAENRIERVAFIKFNVEGAEFPILLGTSVDILRKFDTMLVLYHCDLWEKNTERDLMEHLGRSGFHCVVRERTEERGWIIATRT